MTTEVGKMLRARRLSLGFTQEQLEEMSGFALSQNYISQVESGSIATPSRERLEVFARHLDLELDDLLIAAKLAIAVIPPEYRDNETGLFYLEHIDDLSPEDRAEAERIRRKYQSSD